MASYSRLGLVLLCSCGVAALSACGGADGVASPGEGGIVVTPAPSPSPSPSPSPTPTPGQAADSCPTGTTDVGIESTVDRRQCQLPATITGSLHLENLPGVVYTVSGRAAVGVDVGADGTAADGQAAMLTIDPGVVIFGSSGADYILVNRGSQIFARGTDTQPIIMTSRNNIDGKSGAESQSEWGGLVVLGRAPISNCNASPANDGNLNGRATCQNIVEGTTDALFGGAKPDDNSGTIEYLQVRYGGYAIAPDNELNGITWGAVGSGTKVDHVQVHNSSDDGMEFFGGRVNMKHVVLTGNDDDNIDTDFGYKGFLQYVLVMQRPSGTSGDSIIEADSADGGEDYIPRQQTIISNFTFVHRSQNTAAFNAVLLRGGTDYTLANGVIVTPRTCLDIDGAQTAQAADAAKDEMGPPVFQSVVMQCGKAPFQDDGDIAASQIQKIFGLGSHNDAAFTPSLTAPDGGYGSFIDGAGELAVTPYDASTLDDFGTDGGTRVGSSNSNFFDKTNYIGAVRDASDTWWKNWTCGLSSATAPCTAVKFTS